MALKPGDKCFDLLAIHTLSSCDTMSYPFGKGKVSALNLLLKLDLNLQVFTEPDAEELSLLFVLQKDNGISQQLEIHII